MSNKITKFVSATLAMLLILANSMTLISYAADTLMSENALENQTKSTNVANVEFDVAYDNGKHTKTLDANQTGVLNVQINVKNGGYVKDAQVSFNGANFKIKDDETNPEVVESIDETKNEIKFNQINSGNSISKTLIMQMNDTNINTDVANKDNEISLTAIYVNKDGKETDVNGKVKLNTAWKLDTAELELSHEMTKYAYYQNKLIVQSKVKSNIKENVVPVKDENITVTLPAIDGVNPSYVSVIANSTSATNGNTTKPEWSFDKEQNKVTVKTKNENVAWIKNAQDEFLVTYVYELTNEQVANLKSSEVKISYDVENDVTTYTANNLELKNSVKGTENLSEELGTIADYETNVTTTLNKGYLYNNINTADENKRDTEYTVNYKKTHSQTLLPMLSEAAKMIELDLKTIDAIAVAAGPGSFTGLRIGSATAKGLVLALDKPLVHIPTVDALAFNLYGCEKYICPLMDARRNQVYTGIYRFDGDEFRIIKQQEPMAVEEIAEKLNALDGEVVFLGDGVPVYQELLGQKMQVPYTFAPANMNRQRAASVAVLASLYVKEGKLESAADHKPDYLRLSQAERERAEAMKKQEKALETE